MIRNLMVIVVLIGWSAVVIESFPFRAKRAFSYIANETACTVDHVVYKDGDPIPTDDPCETCSCRPPGFNCVLRHCEIKTGCRAIRRLGECCPSYQCGCEHNGQFYQDGERIHNAESPCYSCYCQGSSITCSLADCKFRFDCEPEYVAGECCPRYDHCPPEAGLTSVESSSISPATSAITTTAAAITSTPAPVSSSTIDDGESLNLDHHRPLFNIDFSKINDTIAERDSTSTTPIPYFMSSALVNSSSSNIEAKIDPKTPTTTTINVRSETSTKKPEATTPAPNRTMAQSSFKKLDEIEPEIPIPFETTTKIPENEMTTTAEVPIKYKNVEIEPERENSTETTPLILAEVEKITTEMPSINIEKEISILNTGKISEPEITTTKQPVRMDDDSSSVTESETKTTEMIPKINQSEPMMILLNSGNVIDLEGKTVPTESPIMDRMETTTAVSFTESFTTQSGDNLTNLNN